MTKLVLNVFNLLFLLFPGEECSKIFISPNKLQHHKQDTHDTSAPTTAAEDPCMGQTNYGLNWKLRLQSDPCFISSMGQMFVFSSQIGLMTGSWGLSRTFWNGKNCHWLSSHSRSWKCFSYSLAIIKLGPFMETVNKQNGQISEVCWMFS